MPSLADVGPTLKGAGETLFFAEAVRTHMYPVSGVLAQEPES